MSNFHYFKAFEIDGPLLNQDSIPCLIFFISMELKEIAKRTGQARSLFVFEITVRRSFD